MVYLLLKSIHIACVVVTVVLFFGRGVLMLVDSPLLNARFLRIAPHVNDTLLLGSALWMAAISRQYPFAESWLTAKLVALIVYICAGMIALSHGRTRRARDCMGIRAAGLRLHRQRCPDTQSGTIRFALTNPARVPDHAGGADPVLRYWLGRPDDATRISPGQKRRRVAG